MLISDYKKFSKDFEGTNYLSKQESLLLKAVGSKSRFEKLMAILPEGWEETYTIKSYDDASTAAQSFMVTSYHKDDRTIFAESLIDAIITSDNHEAVPGKYIEARSKDNEYNWKLNDSLTELTHALFHVDHSLIWISKERSVSIDSNIPIDSVEYKYTINIYIPGMDILTSVENFLKCKKSDKI